MPDDAGQPREDPHRVGGGPRGTAIADPNGAETAVDALYDSFEDDDRPATAAESLAGELLETVRAIDPERVAEWLTERGIRI